MASALAIPPGRDIYANLLRDTRGLRRDQSSARDGWFDSLSWERKEETLFELEMLLKGLACFGNPRNHPGPPQATAAVAHDFREELSTLRDGAERVASLTRQLLGDREKAYTFTRYLETVLPEDAARGRLLQEQLTQDSPEESLFVLRNAFGGFVDLADGLLRLSRVGHRSYAALHGVMTREIGRNVFFNPLVALEFRPEFDRIRQGDILDALHQVHSEAAHRVLALTMLTLFRCLRYLELVDRHAAEHGSFRLAYVLFAVLRSDLRSLTHYLGQRAADGLADGLERDLLAVPAIEIAERRPQLELEAAFLSTLRSALESTANKLRVEVRKVFAHDLPSPTKPADADASAQLVVGAAALRASVQHAIGTIYRVLVPDRQMPRLAHDLGSRRAEAERLRREVWMFMQILRAFIAKAQATEAGGDLWSSAATFQFVRDFLAHFRAIGYQLVRVSDYQRLDPFLSALDALRDVDLLEPGRLHTAIEEAHAFYRFLDELFEQVSQRAELRGVAFDRRDAVETLKIYLGRD